MVRVVAALADQAEQAGDALMPAYTHLRRAQPVLVAHSSSRTRRRCAATPSASPWWRTKPTRCRSAPARSPATPTRIDMPALATRLGFSRVVANSMDAVADRDFVSSFLHAVSLAMVHVSRLAEDVIIFGSEEFGFFDLDDRSRPAAA